MLLGRQWREVTIAAGTIARAHSAKVPRDLSTASVAQAHQRVAATPAYFLLLGSTALTGLDSMAKSLDD